MSQDKTLLEVEEQNMDELDLVKDVFKEMYIIELWLCIPLNNLNYFYKRSFYHFGGARK